MSRSRQATGDGVRARERERGGRGAAAQPPAGGGGRHHAAPRGGARKEDGHGIAVGILVALVALMCFMLPTFIILFGGMAPTWVALITDDRRLPYRVNTIAACNLAGVIPHIAVLWAEGGDLAYAMQILSDVYTWAAMYMGAAAGLAALWIGPHVMAMRLNVQAARQRRALDDIRRALLEEWGPDVLPPPEKRADDKGEAARAQKKPAPLEQGAGQKDMP